MSTVAVISQRRRLDHLHQDTGQQVRAAFHIAKQTAGQPLARFARAYGDELERVQANIWDVHDGEPDTRQHVSLVWLHTSGHLASVRGPVMRALQQATHESLSATLAGQRRAFEDAQTVGVQLVAQTKDDDGGDETPVMLPPVPSGRYGVSGHDGRPLATYFDALPPQAWQRIEKAANAGVAMGQSANDLLNALLDVVGGIASWALLIALQELTSAWRDFMTWLFGANQTNWRWRAQPGACDFCLSMDGTVHSGDEDMDSHPRCQCIQEPTNDPVTS